MRVPYSRTMKSIVFCCFITGLLISQGKISEAQESSNDNLQQLISLIDQLSKDNQRISENIIREDYSSAQSSSDNLIASLANLVEIFIPLEERLKNLIVEERKIQNGTVFLQKEKIPLSNSSKRLALSVMEEQKLNRDKTKKTALIIKSQVATLKEKKDRKGDVGNEGKKNLLEEIEKLVSSAGTLENSALRFMKKTDFVEAEQKVLYSIEELEKALKKLRKDGKKKQSNQESDQQNKKKSDENREQKKNTEGIEKKRGKNKKMSSRDALKKLTEIQKRNRDELKKREKRFGKLKLPEQVPVEKDW